MERFKSFLCKSHRDMQNRTGCSFTTQIQNQADYYRNIEVLDKDYWIFRFNWTLQALMLARSHFAAFVHLFEREPLPGLPWLYKSGAGRLKALKGCFCGSGSLRAQSARTGLSLTTILGAKPGWEPSSLYPKHTHTHRHVLSMWSGHTW